ncbi:protein PHYTOCHROME KINASE SUBSTRATE 1-like [Cornus florida]|uniref:protein PHYTOCHROME KINASE SUBSTRATE 1-like n=1 Tax=Cornus florida TaxID=4283 RepID=UPI0028994B6A|nr:protein PHYTOCHROME KINASE SUBSTRATE 1-like [Cornus florida]
MAMVTLTSPCNTNFSQALSKENNNNNKNNNILRDASFSSYLNGAEECFVLKLAESNQELRSFITSPHEHLYLGRNKVSDEEIGVFSAEKYLNGGVDEEDTRIANRRAIKYKKDDQPVDIGPITTKPPPQTPSVHSESSWNSRNSLLLSVKRNPAPRKGNGRRSFLASLGCSCSCRNKHSVDIDESGGESNSNTSVKCGVVQSETIPKEPIKTAIDSVDLARINKSNLDPIVKEEMKYDKFDELGLKFRKEECFSFPNLNCKTGSHENEDDKRRKSSEVFGSPILEKGVKPLGLSRRLSMLSWDATPRVEGTDTAAYFDAMYNDVESDTSSDLFEIESFTNNANPNPNSCLARQASDGMSCCVTPTTCYAPSEASIEWSVVTASAADFSVVSDYEELRTAAAAATKTPNRMAPAAKAAVAAPSKEAQRRRPGLLGCKSHKAVRIAGDVYRSNRTNEEAVPDLRWRYKPDSFAPVTRFRAEAKLTSF